MGISRNNKRKHLGTRDPIQQSLNCLRLERVLHQEQPEEQKTRRAKKKRKLSPKPFSMLGKWISTNTLLQKRVGL
jgi:hypothetical protein